MSVNPDHSAENAEIRQQASAWLARQDRGLTAIEQDELSDWITADARHGIEFARLRERWRQLDRLVEWRPEHGAKPNPDLLAPSAPLRFPRLMVGVLSLAAAVAVGLGYVVWQSRTKAAQQHPSVVLAQSTEPRRVLPDGSVIELNRDAVVTVDYSPATRRVRLEKGEAHFTVQKDPSRPFIVTAHGIDVRAVGTAFNVRMDSSVVEVLVTEGKVRVDSVSPGPIIADAPGEPPVREPLVPQLEARQRAILSVASVDIPPQIATLTGGEIERVLAWQHRLLEFTATPLAEVVAEFNKRNVVQIVIVDADLSAEPVTAAVRSDNVEGFVRLIQSGFAGFAVRIERKGDAEIFLHKVH